MAFDAETGDYLEVVKLLRTVTGLPIIVSPEARQIISDEALVLELELRAPIAVADLLDLMVSRSPDLAWTIRHDVVVLTSKALAGGDSVLMTHDIRDLVFPRTEFIPPVIAGIPTGEATAPRSGYEGDEKVAMIEPDRVVQMITMSTAADYWDTEGGGTIEFVESGYLLVNANAAMQREVARVLARLR